MLLRTKQATVYRRGDYSVLSCSDYERPIELTADYGRSPLIDLNGIVLAYLHGDSEDGVGIQALRLGATGPTFVAEVWFQHPVRFGSISVTSHHDLAWITCSLPSSLWHRFQGDGVNDPPMSSKPNCIRPGRGVDTVHYIRPHEFYAHTLDKGAWLDPRSLRRRDNTITWLRDGIRHSYQIPTRR